MKDKQLNNYCEICERNFRFNGSGNYTNTAFCPLCGTWIFKKEKKDGITIWGNWRKEMIGRNKTKNEKPLSSDEEIVKIWYFKKFKPLVAEADIMKAMHYEFKHSYDYDEVKEILKEARKQEAIK